MLSSRIEGGAQPLRTYSIQITSERVSRHSSGRIFAMQTASGSAFAETGFFANDAWREDYSPAGL